MANIRTIVSSTGSKTYQACWSTYDSKGKRHRHAQTFGKASDAKTYARRMEREVEDAGISTDKTQTFAKLSETCLREWARGEKRAPATLRQYSWAFSRLSREFGDTEISKITPRTVSEAFSNIEKNGGSINNKQRSKPDAKPKKLSPSSLAVLHKIAFMAFDLARKWKEIPGNPMVDIDPPKLGKRKPKAMTEQQAGDVFRQAIKEHEAGIDPGMDVAVAILYSTGLRVSELLGLAIDAVDLANHTITISSTVIIGKEGVPILRSEQAKTAAGLRTISIPLELGPLIRRQHAFILGKVLEWGRQDWITEPLLLFPELGGLPRNPNRFSVRMKRLMKRVGVVGLPPTHTFRHSMASSLLADGVDIQTVSTRLGHTSAAFTLRTYITSIDGTDKAAAAQIGARFAAMNKT